MYIKNRYVNHLIYEQEININEDFMREMNECFHKETSAPINFMITIDHLHMIYVDHCNTGIMTTDYNDYDVKYDIGDWICDYITDYLAEEVDKPSVLVGAEFDDLEMRLVED